MAFEALSSAGEDDGSMHRKSRMSELEEICRGTKDSEGIEHRNRGSSGSGLWDDSGRERPGGAGTSTGLREGCERAGKECDISGIKCPGKYTASDSALSPEGATRASVNETDDVSREESGSSDVAPSVRSCDVN